MKKSYVYWLFQVVGWFAFAIFQIFLLWFSGQPVDKMLGLGEGLQMIINILLTHSFRLIIVRFRWLNFRLIKLIPLVIVSVLLLSMVASVSHFIILLMQSSSGLKDVPADALIEALVIGFLESALVYSFWSLAYFIFLFFERYNNSLKYEATLRETELNNLRAQLKPPLHLQCTQQHSCTGR